MKLRNFLSVTSESANVFIEDGFAGKKYLIKKVEGPRKRILNIDDEVLNKNIVFIQSVDASLVAAYGFEIREDAKVIALVV